MIDRTFQPPVCEPEDFSIQRPECQVLPNGIPLNILNIGDNEVVRIDVLMKGGDERRALAPKPPLAGLVH